MRVRSRDDRPIGASIIPVAIPVGAKQWSGYKRQKPEADKQA
jgi:hypothetical protein